MTELQQAEARLSKLIEDMSGSIQTEVASIQGEMAGLHTEMRDGFERVEAATGLERAARKRPTAPSRAPRTCRTRPPTRPGKPAKCCA